MNASKKTPWLLSLSLLLVGLFLGHFSAKFSVDEEHKAAVEELQAANQVADQALNSTKLALEIAKTKANTWRAVAEDAAIEKPSMVLP